MNKSLKALFMASMLPFMMLMAAVTLTSCEGTLDDIFGEWSRPTGQQNNEPTKEELLSDLSSALEDGAIVTFTYTIEGVEYTSTFKRVGDEYILQNTTPAATRTRSIGTSSDYPEPRVYIVKNEAKGETIMRMEVIINNVTYIDVSINVDNAEASSTYGRLYDWYSAVNLSINDKPVDLKNGRPEFVDIKLENGQLLGEVYYFTGESWSDVTTASQENGGKCLQIGTANQVIFTADNFSGYLVYKDGTTVDPSDKVGCEDGVYYLKEFPPFAYLELSWDETNNKVVSSIQQVSKFNLVTSSQTGVTWNAGTYVVNQDITINGNISFNGDVNLILCDGCSLTVNGMIDGKEKSLNIYGQAAGSGKLIQNKIEFGLCNFTDLVIHGGNIEMGNNRNLKFSLKMYGGKFTARSSVTYPIIDLMLYYNNITIYGGELEAVNDAVDAIIVGSDANPGTLTVYGGKVTASAPNGQAIKGNFVKGKDAEGYDCPVGFYVTDDLSDWGDALVDVTTSTSHYFKAIPETE